MKIFQYLHQEMQKMKLEDVKLDLRLEIDVADLRNNNEYKSKIRYPKVPEHIV